jgi:CubicO group peptidase (beta-lactamase class C family)
LYLRGGQWEGRELLPASWVEYARTPTYQQPTDQGCYGAHWWIDMVGPGTFSANGYEGQFTILVPELDLILVRHGSTPATKMENLKGWLKAVVDSFHG